MDSGALAFRKVQALHPVRGRLEDTRRTRMPHRPFLQQLGTVDIAELLEGGSAAYRSRFPDQQEMPSLH